MTVLGVNIMRACPLTASLFLTIDFGKTRQDLPPVASADLAAILAGADHSLYREYILYFPIDKIHDTLVLPQNTVYHGTRSNSEHRLE